MQVVINVLYSKINSENVSDDEIKNGEDINNKQLIYHENSKNLEI
jgi:hypothetical protein